MNTTAPTTYRAACSALRPTQHGGLRLVPTGAVIAERNCTEWITVEGERALCGFEGCARQLRAVAILDSHRGTGARRECSGVCINAIGPACDCKCRGINHATNH
jgi:hypothetical protein